MKTKQSKQIAKIYFGVLRSFQLFLASNVHVAASGVFFYARRIISVAQQRSGEARGGQNTFLTFVGGRVVKQTGGSEKSRG